MDPGVRRDDVERFQRHAFNAMKIAIAAISSSSRRRPGPITTGVRGYDRSSNSVLESKDHAVWIPAFAGTTLKDFNATL
jgi:hypothetical protein